MDKYDLKRVIKEDIRTSEQVLTSWQVKQIYGRLLKYAGASTRVKEDHIYALKTY